jgi:hypothetical protein
MAKLKGHLKKHHKKYSKIIVLFFAILIATMIKDLTIVYVICRIFDWKVILMALGLAVIFAIIGEYVENDLEKYIKKIANKRK